MILLRSISHFVYSQCLAGRTGVYFHLWRCGMTKFSSQKAESIIPYTVIHGIRSMEIQKPLIYDGLLQGRVVRLCCI